MNRSPVLELLSQLSTRPKPVGDILTDLRVNLIELRALLDDLRIEPFKVSTKLFRDPHNTDKITHIAVNGESWARAQEIAADYERAKELTEAA